jgi:hypothetical protein
MTGYLIQYDEHPKWKILKIQILSSCGHFVEHWQQQIKSNQILLVLHCSSSLHACSHALGGCLVDASPLCPDPSPGRRRRRGGSTPGPPSLLPSSLHVDDHPALASADPQHSAAEPATPQHASVAAVTGERCERRQGPREDELLAELVPVAPAYIKPLRSNESTHLTPLYLPDIAAHSLLP